MKGFDFDDVLILPDVITTIGSRSECTPLTNEGTLPIIAAPMYDVIGPKNVDEFRKQKVVTILPRSVDNPDMKVFDFYAFGLSEEIDDDFVAMYSNAGILIDIANGHMNELVSKVKEVKSKMPDCKLMVGNIARPETYRILAEAGADYIRCGIGTGQVCLTTTNSGIGSPLAWLIQECKKVKQEYGLEANIVADGGLKKYSDIVKAIALGADYCMLGGIFAKSMESMAPKYQRYMDEYFDIQEPDETMFENTYARYSGMSTKEAQRRMGKEESEIKTSEGTVRYLKIEYKLSTWIENFEHYLRSAMSYTNSRTLEEFKQSEVIQITENTFKRIDK